MLRTWLRTAIENGFLFEAMFGPRTETIKYSISGALSERRNSGTACRVSRICLLLACFRSSLSNNVLQSGHFFSAWLSFAYPMQIWYTFNDLGRGELFDDLN
jgi:hypothetical protein